MSTFLKGTNDFESLNLSEISDVDPDEIEKIIRSASEIDEKYIGSEKLKTNKGSTSTSKHEGEFLDVTLPVAVKKESASGLQPPLLRKEERADLASILDFPFGGASQSNVERKAEKKTRGSGDWLGLKDSPERRKSAGSGMDLFGLDMASRELSSGGRAKDSSRGLSGSKDSSRGLSGSKDRLLDELFGETKLPAEPTFRHGAEGEKSGSYQPSAVENFLPSGRRSAGPRRPPSARVAETFETKEVQEKHQDVAEELPFQPSIEPRPKKTLGESGVGGLPDWLRGGLTEEKEEEVRVPERKGEPSSDEVQIVDIPSHIQHVGSTDIVTLLANVQKELGSALAKRSDNIQHYMKALMLEAERMLSVPGVSEESSHLVTDSKPLNEKVKQAEEREDKNTEIIKQQEDQIHQVQISVKELDLQNSRLQLEIENLKSTHKMEVDTLQKNHSYELSAYEARISRMKTSFDEIEAEYKEKIAKLKENEEVLIREYSERLERAEKMRLTELDKLGELHQAALQQAAAFSIPLHNSGKVVRIPLITSGRPKDEVELSERENTLLEKEKQVEVMRGALEGEQEELEAVRMAQEERERELRRTEREARQREEARQAEAARERAQLDAQALQIKEMRAEALREQGAVTKEKLELAAERARLEALYSIHGRTDSSISPLDLMQARVEVEAALETAKEAQEAAELERRKHAERRHTVEQISWEQKEADLKLESREKHLLKMLENAEKIRNEGLAALDEAKNLRVEIEKKEIEVQEQFKKIEAQEKIFSKERLDIAREKMDLERKRSQLDVLLPDLMASEEMSLNVPRVFVDPKAVILRLKAEKEFESSTFKYPS